MTDFTTDLDFHAPATRFGNVSRLSRVLRVIARTLADFNRYMDAAQQVYDVQRFR